MENTSINNKIGYLNDNFKIFHIKDKKNIEFEYHHHDFNKIIIFISGKATYLIEGKSYNLRPWDILFVNNNEIHKPIIDSSEFYERIVIWINPEFVSKYNEDECNLLTCFELALQNEYNLLRLNIEYIEKIRYLISQLESNDKNKEFGSEVLKNALFLQLIIIINRLFLRSEKNKEIEDIKYDKTIESILNYVNNNLQEDLSIDNIASKFFMSKYYLMHRFKSQTGSSIHNYIIQKRLILAKFLIKKGFSMNDVCIECGFNDYSSFVRAFKKMYGLSPRNYYKSIFQFDDSYTNE